MSEAFCAAVDWGTTSFRIWLLDATGKALAMRRSREGLSHCAPDRFAGTLEAHLAALGAPAGLPVVACGMAGSRQGWVEAPYLDVPARPESIATRAVGVPGANRPIRILPGIAQRDRREPDVMRGEETQLLGVMASETGRWTACLPGSHSKWVEMEEGCVRRFHTFMTGELYAAIGTHTILAHSIDASAGMLDEDAFRQGIADSLADPCSLTAGLFAIRAGMLLGFSDHSPAASRLSGLLIGSEIAAARQLGFCEHRIRLVASGELAERYGRAFALAGIDTSTSGAEETVVAGLFAAARLLFAEAGVLGVTRR